MNDSVLMLSRPFHGAEVKSWTRKLSLKNTRWHFREKKINNSLDYKSYPEYFKVAEPKTMSFISWRSWNSSLNWSHGPPPPPESKIKRRPRTSHSRKSNSRIWAEVPKWLELQREREKKNSIITNTMKKYMFRRMFKNKLDFDSLKSNAKTCEERQMNDLFLGTWRASAVYPLVCCFRYYYKRWHGKSRRAGTEVGKIPRDYQLRKKNLGRTTWLWKCGP